VAETGAEHSTNREIWFNEAVTLLAERSGESTDYTEQLLVKGLEDGVPWSHMKDGIRVKGDAAFWQHRRVDPLFEVYRAKNSASYIDPTGEGYGGPPRPLDVPGSVKDIKVSCTAALALLPAAPSETPTPPSTSPSPRPPRRQGPQIDRAVRALRNLFPPDGKVPAGMGVETVRGKVAAALESESQDLGKADPSWDVVAAAIDQVGRRPT
jgi:hypothetical protein